MDIEQHLQSVCYQFLDILKNYPQLKDKVPDALLTTTNNIKQKRYYSGRTSRVSNELQVLFEYLTRQ